MEEKVPHITPTCRAIIKGRRVAPPKASSMTKTRAVVKEVKIVLLSDWAMLFCTTSA